MVCGGCTALPQNVLGVLYGVPSPLTDIIVFPYTMDFVHVNDRGGGCANIFHYKGGIN